MAASSLGSLATHSPRRLNTDRIVPRSDPTRASSFHICVPVVIFPPHVNCLIHILIILGRVLSRTDGHPPLAPAESLMHQHVGYLIPHPILFSTDSIAHRQNTERIGVSGLLFSLAPLLLSTDLHPPPPLLPGRTSTPSVCSVSYSHPPSVISGSALLGRLDSILVFSLPSLV